METSSSSSSSSFEYMESSSSSYEETVSSSSEEQEEIPVTSSSSDDGSSSSSSESSSSESSSSSSESSSSSSDDKEKEYTVRDWLFGRVNFNVPESAVEAILRERDVDGDTEYADRSGLAVDVRLLKADLLKWIVLGAGKVNNTSDVDNGWSHSDGGYTLSKDDKRMLIDEANAIYAELEPASVFGKKKARMRSAGIMPAYRDTDGEPLERMPL